MTPPAPPARASRPGRVTVGSAGFSYPDWAGVVHPRASARHGEARHPLVVLASLVDLLEVNVSYYRIPTPEIAASWLARTAHRPGFRFTAKLWRGFTHGPERASRADLAAMRAFFGALDADRRLLAVLAQFPPTFRASARTEAYVHRLAEHVEGRPLAVELRDVSWDRDDVRQALAERGISWVVGDLPVLPRGVPPRPLATTPLAYVRLHGRNPAWGEPGSARDRRYDWLYDEAALADFASWIDVLRQEAAETLVVTNNHFEGKGIANALELRARIEGGKVLVPETLVNAYPRLAAIARDAEGSLWSTPS